MNMSTYGHLIEWIRQTVGNASVVIGISGGKDSSVVATLCRNALGPSRVYGVEMPDGEQWDIDKSDKLIDFLGIQKIKVNIHPAVEAAYACLPYPRDGLKSTVTTNLPARIRMATLYNIAAQIGNCRVANTCNLSEDYIGWSTKFGDSAGDFGPISKLTCTEVIKLGESLGIPDDLVHKAPSDGMCGSTDEEKFGFTYQELDSYIRGVNISSPAVTSKIEKMHAGAMHKILPMPTFDPKY